MLRESDGGTYNGTSGNDNYTGSSGDDNFYMSDGGSDTVSGAGGYDHFYFGASFDATDKVTDTGHGLVYLDGDYSGGLTVTKSMLSGVYVLSMAAGHAYHVTFGQGVVPAGQTLNVGAGGWADVDISADSYGGFYDVYFSAGHSTFTGGLDYANVYVQSNAQLQTDRLVGGLGTDALHLSAAGKWALNDQVLGFDWIKLPMDHYALKLGDQVVAPGHILNIGAETSGVSLRFDGHLETDGAFQFGPAGGLSAGANSKLIGGAGDDGFDWGAYDTVTGGGGADQIVGWKWAIYKKVSDSTPQHPDHIWNADGSKLIDLRHVDADTTVKGNQAFELVSAFTHHAGELTIRALEHGAEILGDVNGDGYAELEILITASFGYDVMTFSNFLL